MKLFVQTHTHAQSCADPFQFELGAVTAHERSKTDLYLHSLTLNKPSQEQLSARLCAGVGVSIFGLCVPGFMCVIQHFRGMILAGSLS